MVARGHAAELLALLLGESKYNREDSPGAPSEQSARRLRTDALLHLNYVHRSGHTEGRMTQDGKVYAAYPKEFEDWLAAGSPGVTDAELQAFLDDHPELLT